MFLELNGLLSHVPFFLASEVSFASSTVPHGHGCFSLLRAFGPPILLLPFLAGSSTKSCLAFASVRFLLRATRPSSARAAGRCRSRRPRRPVAAPLFRLPGLPLSPCFFYEPPAAGRRAPEPQPWSPVCHFHHGSSRNRGPPRAGAATAVDGGTVTATAGRGNGHVPVASPHSNMIHKFFSLKLYKIKFFSF